MKRNEAIDALLAPEAGAWWQENGPSNWRGVIALGGTNFTALQAAAEEALKKVAKAKTLQDLRNINVSYSGGFDFHYGAHFSCPEEHRVAELRREADALEQNLKLKASVV